MIVLDKQKKSKININIAKEIDEHKQENNIYLEIRYWLATFKYHDEYLDEYVYLNISIVHAVEKCSSNDNKIEWFLMYTDRINDVSEAIKLVKYYNMRWTIEVWHKILKTDACRVEQIEDLNI